MSAGPQHLGRTIAGRFRITGLIGEGAMAAVYRGEQDAEPRDVAVKIMHAQLLGDQTFVGRFRREAKAASRLKHPNTVQIIESGVDGRLPYIVMELVVGQDLFDLLAAERRLSEPRAVRIMIGICEALIAAHEQGIVHRDLKPENVMILRDPDGLSNQPGAPRDRVKVLDFGIAKMVEGGSRVGDEAPNSLSNGALTTVGVVVGTPAYMSPEQCKGDPVDGRSDVYACGILLFLLVTGRLPFPPTSIPWEVAMDHLRKPPPAPSTFLPQIHPALEAAILTALSKWPAQRQQSALELRDELERILPQLPDVAQAVIGVGALLSTPTMESIPVSVRSRVTIASPMREVEILPAPPLEGAFRRGESEAPPSFSSDGPTRAIPMADLPPLAVPGAAAVVRGAPAGPPPGAPPVEPAFDMVLRMRPLSDAPPSDQPPSSEMVIHHRSDFDAFVARTRAAGGVGGLGAPAMPTGLGAAGVPAGLRAPAMPTGLEAAGVPAGRGAPPAPRPSLASLPAVAVAAPEAPVRKRARRAPTRPTDSWIVKLVVPLAVLFGLALGVLAFLLSR